MSVSLLLVPSGRESHQTTQRGVTMTTSSNKGPYRKVLTLGGIIIAAGILVASCVLGVMEAASTKTETVVDRNGCLVKVETRTEWTSLDRHQVTTKAEPLDKNCGREGTP